VALFNTTDAETKVGADLAALGLKGRVAVRDLWARKADGVAEGRLERMLPAHGSGLYRLG
jgi:hypothetical protein